MKRGKEQANQISSHLTFNLDVQRRQQNNKLSLETR